MTDDERMASIIEMCTRIRSAMGDFDEVDGVFALSKILGGIVEVSERWTSHGIVCAIVDYMAAHDDVKPIAFLAKVSAMHIEAAAERGDAEAQQLFAKMQQVQSQQQRTSGPRRVLRVSRRHRRS